MSHIYHLDLDRHETYECGAMLVSLLAYPEDNEQETKRSDLHASLCAIALRAQFDESSPEWCQPQLIKPVYAFRDATKTDRDLKTLERRLRDRMVAARMAIPLLQEIKLGRPPKLPDDLKRLSINALSEFVLKDAAQTEPKNVETRIWRPSLPVIHVAAATAVISELAEKDGHSPISYGQIVVSRPVIEAIVREAERYEELLEKSGKFNINPEKLVKVRLV